MLRRLWRVIRSWLGFAVDSVESPDLILQQNIRDLEAEVPRLNEQMATIVGQKNVVVSELERLKQQEADLTNKVKGALKVNRRDIAQQYVMAIEKLKPDIQAKERAVQVATNAYDKANAAKAAFLAEKDKKIAAAKSALSAKRQAEWNEKIANTLANFQVGSIDNTNDEMIRRIEEDAAKSEAKLQMALDSKSTNGLSAQLAEDAAKIQAEESLRQFELSMGVAPAAPMPTDPDRTVEKTLGPKSLDSMFRERS